MQSQAGTSLSSSVAGGKSLYRPPTEDENKPQRPLGSMMSDPRIKRGPAQAYNASTNAPVGWRDAADIEGGMEAGVT
jgi:hypothetical protein